MDIGMRRLERRCRRVITIAGAALAFASLSSAAWAACSCTNLTVHHADAATVKICTNNTLNFKECTWEKGSSTNGCDGYQRAYTCPTGVNNAVGEDQQTGFGVDATVTGNSADCNSGQALQLTITSNRSVDKPKVHPTPSGDVTIGTFAVSIDNTKNALYPDVGTVKGLPYFGADNYTDPASTKNAGDIASRSRTEPSVMTPTQPSPACTCVCTSPQNAPNPVSGASMSWITERLGSGCVAMCS